LPADQGEAAMPEPEPGERFPRSVFLENATLGLGAVIGGIVTVPVVGFAIAPVFEHVHHKEVDVGPIDNFKEGEFVVTTFNSDKAEGDVARRTAYIRNNGVVGGKPSFTVLSNRCAHLGCPVQANGPIFPKQHKVENTKAGEVSLTPTLPAGGFGCPCHGGQYDQEGNRTAGPPVRALDRFEFYIRNGRLLLGKRYSVSHVVGAGASAKIYKYRSTDPGEHVDGWEQIFYPFQPPH
jgi:menaquinol-cytochrome c reductase iron-sulfur subunit